LGRFIHFILAAPNLTRRKPRKSTPHSQNPTPRFLMVRFQKGPGRGAHIFLAQSYEALRWWERKEAMARKKVDDLIADLEKILRVFTKNPELKVGDITAQSLGTTISDLRGKSTELEDAKTLATRLVNELEDQVGGGRQVQTRGLSGIRAAFGPDSSEYEEAGGVRTSERKKPSKKKKE
jgi:hypothetical protein